MSKTLERQIRACTLCEKHLPYPPKPVFRLSSSAPLLIVGQAPGTRVHESGIPWNDPSGNRLRDWLNVDTDTFYDPEYIAIVPMGLCYPGNRNGSDLPPRPECAPKWMPPILESMQGRRLTLLIGQYAIRYFLGKRAKSTLTDTVRHWREYRPDYFVLPHPSPRNNSWLKRNPWFEDQLVPQIQEEVHSLLKISP